jgi:hypothetical protein
MAREGEFVMSEHEEGHTWTEDEDDRSALEGEGSKRRTRSRSPLGSRRVVRSKVMVPECLSLQINKVIDEKLDVSLAGFQICQKGLARSRQTFLVSWRSCS